MTQTASTTKRTVLGKRPSLLSHHTGILRSLGLGLAKPLTIKPSRNKVLTSKWREEGKDIGLPVVEVVQITAAEAISLLSGRTQAPVLKPIMGTRKKSTSTKIMGMSPMRHLMKSNPLIRSFNSKKRRGK